MPLSPTRERLCSESTFGYSDLKVVLINTSLKKRPSDSHTRLLLEVVGTIMEKIGVDVEHVHMLSHQVPPGVYPDMTEHGWDRDDWPVVWEKVLAADILVVGTPLWLGEESSVCRVLIERLYGMSGLLNDRGQSVYYDKVAGSVITGNEDGIEHTAMTIGYTLSRLGYTIPPQADCGWIGKAGPGPSYGDELADGSRAGFDNDFTQRNTTIMTSNLMHMARILKDAGGIPNHGNDRERWKAGCRLDYANPEYRSKWTPCDRLADPLVGGEPDGWPGRLDPIDREGIEPGTKRHEHRATRYRKDHAHADRRHAVPAEPREDR